MSYGPPVLNLLGNLWVAPAKPSTGAATTTNIACQKFISTNGPMLTNAALGGNPWTMTTIIKVLVGAIAFKRANIWEVPAGSGKYYYTVYCETFYQGFASQYDGWVVFQCDANATVPRTY